MTTIDGYGIAERGALRQQTVVPDHVVAIAGRPHRDRAVLVVVERQQWQRDCCVTAAAAGILLSEAEAIDLREDWGLLAFRWPRQPD